VVENQHFRGSAAYIFKIDHKLSLNVMDNASYHSVLEKNQQSWRRDNIIAWLQEKTTTLPERVLNAELLHLATANKSPRKR
jgi:hypothetical protein